MRGRRGSYGTAKSTKKGARWRSRAGSMHRSVPSRSANRSVSMDPVADLLDTYIGEHKSFGSTEYCGIMHLGVILCFSKF
jgi:hypothetical protein